MPATPDPVPSGQAFEVLAVHGRTPHTLEDFLDDAVFTFRSEQHDRPIAGRGHRDGDNVLFTEKDVNHGGEDVRVWEITAARHLGQFTARTVELSAGAASAVVS
jgi:hypothetical protein